MKNKTTSVLPVTTPRITKKRDYYSHALADKAKDQRRAEAEVRNAHWRSLTKEQQIRSLATRPGNSRRQVSAITGYDKTPQEIIEMMEKEGLRL